MTEVDARLQTTRESMRMLMAASGALPLGGEQVAVDLCFVGAQPQDHAALSRAAAAFAGVAPQASRSRGMDLYVWAEGPNGHVAVGRPGDRETMALMQSGRVRMLFVQRRGEMSMIGYAVPRVRGRSVGGPTAPELR